MRRILCTALAVLLVCAAHAGTPSAHPAANLSGIWQGSIEADGLPLRFVLRIKASPHGALQATLFSIDQSPAPIAVSATQTGSTLKLVVPPDQTYAGTVSPDGASIDGQWTQPEHPEIPMSLRRVTQRTAWPLDASPHKVRFVTVAHDVKLEVLDWGGAGRPLVLLAGLGNDAHVYDRFAPKLTASYHVLGITRRGYGASSAPAKGYGADRLADDVIEALTALHIERPLLAGHSIAGEELSSIAARHPDTVAGLIYLDAGYPYAFYNEASSDGRLRLQIDANELQSKLEALRKGDRSAAQQLRTIELPRLAQDLEAVEAAPPPPPLPPGPSQAVFAGMQRYLPAASVPLLAIYADPHNDLASEPIVEAQVAFLEHALPAAHVLRLAHADHYVFRSNEADPVI